MLREYSQPFFVKGVKLHTQNCQTIHYGLSLNKERVLLAH